MWTREEGRSGVRGETARWFAVLAAVPFVMVLGNSMLIPVLPTLKARLGLTPVEMGLVITAFSLPAGATIPLAGALSDRVGRKAVMVPALVLYGVGGLLAGLAAWLMPGRFWPILAARALQGVGAGGTYQLAMALAGDVFQSRERVRALGLLEASNGLGKVVSPLLGALAALGAWFLPFFVYGMVALPTAAGVYLAVPEPSGGRTAQGMGAYLRQLGSVARRRGAMLAASYGAGLVALFALFGVLSYVSDVLEQLSGLGQLGRGAVIAIPVGLMAAVAYAAGVYLQRRPAHATSLAVGGLVVASGGLLMLGLQGEALRGLIVGASALGLGVGAVLPAINAAVTGAAPRGERGAVTALYGTVRFSGVAAGPPVFGLAQQPELRLAIFGACAAATALAAWGVAANRLPVGQGSSPSSAGLGRSAG